ncbi:hypothetical protein M1513_00600 [Patescibacteria group bacterium]|nr:hypothetical protein [Patescibacteria group bacterium]MCL5733530.1 hypothetical protein [Patescibacteria group bacterium]
MKKNIYILIIILIIAVAVAVLWSVFGSANKVAAPTSKIQNSSTSQSAAFAPSAYFNETTSASLGVYLTDAKGMTLYTFTHDSPNISNCTGVCLSKWSPYGPGIRAGGIVNLPMLPENVGTIKGNNGMIQFTWKNMPLYYYYQDKNAGDTFGEGVLGAWYVVKI